MTGTGSTFIEPQQWNLTGTSCQRGSTWLRRLSTNAYGDCRLHILRSIANCEMHSTVSRFSKECFSAFGVFETFSIGLKSATPTSHGAAHNGRKIPTPPVNR